MDRPFLQLAVVPAVSRGMDTVPAREELHTRPEIRMPRRTLLGRVPFIADARWARAAVLAALLVAAAALLPGVAFGERIKDIATVAGVRGNQLVGYGLVVGLDGTGDQTSQTPFTIQALKNMLAQLGVLVPENVNPQLRNVAAVTGVRQPRRRSVRTARRHQFL